MSEKHHFELILVCGTLGQDNVDFPIPTLALGSGKASAKNLLYLGKQGVYTTEKGLMVGYLDGVYNESAFNLSSSTDTFYNESDVNHLCSNANVDILLTREWAAGITKFSEIGKTLGEIPGSHPITRVLCALNPRYHFASMPELYYPREPYSRFAKSPCTRFVGLSKLGNEKKERVD
jgi:hypothetical protein